MKQLYSVDASRVLTRYRAELYHGDLYDRGDPIWISTETYATVEEALEAARHRIAVEERNHDKAA